MIYDRVIYFHSCNLVELFDSLEINGKSLDFTFNFIVELLHFSFYIKTLQEIIN